MSNLLIIGAGGYSQLAKSPVMARLTFLVTTIRMPLVRLKMCPFCRMLMKAAL